MCCFCWKAVIVVDSQLLEHERVAEYKARGHSWPAPEEDFIPNTKGWRDIFQRRLKQVQHIENPHEKNNGFVSSVYQAFISKNFTEYGWALTKAPQVRIFFYSTHIFFKKASKFDIDKKISFSF